MPYSPKSAHQTGDHEEVVEKPFPVLLYFNFCENSRKPFRFPALANHNRPDYF